MCTIEERKDWEVKEMDVIRTFEKGLKMLESVVETTTERISENDRMIQSLNDTNTNMEFYRNKAQKILDM